MIRKWRLQIACMMGLLFCLGGNVWAEENAVHLRGTIRSVSGSPIADAVVSLRNLSQEEEVVIQADAQGHYEAARLAPGRYRIQVSAPGFREQARQEVQLTNDQEVTTNFLLEPNSMGAGPVRSETAKPATPAPSAAPAGVIDESLLAGLPLNGRSYSQLTTLKVGISGDTFGSGKEGSRPAGMKVAGGRREWNSFLLDGTDINDATNQVPRSAAGGQLGADAVMQVQVFSINYGAQYGRAAGGVMNAITRSGGNQWHGTVFEYLRNSKLDARNFFDEASVPPFKRNQFGATTTGPVVKEKSFFMVSFEALRNRLTETELSFVPDNEVRAGVLELPGKPRVEVVPEVKPYLLLYPSADNPLLRNGQRTGIAENRTGISQPSNEYFFTARIDQSLGDRNAMFARYTFDDANTTDAGSSPAFPTLTESRQQYLTLTETHFFSPALVNTLRLSYTRPVSQSSSAPTFDVPPNLFFVPGAPQFGTIGVPGLIPLGPGSSLPSAKVTNTYQVADDIIWNRGPHSWKIGFLMERFQWNAFDSTNMGADWSFNSLESFLQAGPTSTTTLRVALPGSTAERAYRQSLFGLYAQDDYKVRSNLTLNLGLRYEFTTIIHDAKGRDVYLKDEIRDTVSQTGSLMSRNPSLRNFAPRFGLSWSPWGNASNLVVRAGFGIYYDQIIEYGIDSKRGTPPFFNLAVRQNFISNTTFPRALDAASQGGVVNQSRIFEYNNPRTPTAYRYNLSLQREFFPGLTVEASYVGGRGNHMLRSYEANLFPAPELQPNGSLYFPAQCNKLPNNAAPSEFARCRTYAGPINPAFSSIERTTTDAQSFHNSFVLSVNRRLWNGLSLGANYTFSKSVDEAAGAYNFERHYGIQRTLNRSLDPYESRHRLSLNYFYSLPFGAGQRWLNSGWVAPILGGWRLGGILSVRTGTADEAFFRIAYPGYLFISQRTNLAPGRSNNPTKGVTIGCEGVPAGQELGGPDLFFDPCSFVPPPPGTIGNSARNTIVGPRVLNLDFSLQKNFVIDARRTLEFRAEFFNLPNHSNFNVQDATGGGTIFKDAVGTRNPIAGRLTSTATASRQIQFALRLSF